MRHQAKTLRLLLALIAAAVCAAALALGLTGGEGPAAAGIQARAVTQYDARQVEKITVRNAGGTYAVDLNGAASTATISGLGEAVPLNRMALSGAVQKLLHCESYADPVPVTEETLSAYGLDPPAAGFTVDLRDGTRQVFLVGAQTVTKSGYYLWRQGGGSAYVVENAVHDYACYPAGRYIATELARIDQDEAFKITELSLYDARTRETLAVRQKRQGDPISAYSLNSYVATRPALLDASDENLKTYVFGALSPLEASGVYSLDCSAGNLRDLGFDAPDQVLSFTAEGREYVFSFCSAPDGALLVMRQGVPVVYTMESASAPFLQMTLDQIVSPFLTLQSITEIDAFAAEAAGGKYTFSLGEADGALTVRYDGADIDTDSFRRLYSLASQICISGMAREPAAKTCVLRLSYHRKDGTVPVVEFFEEDGRMCYAAVNGEGRFLVRLSDIETFLRALAACVQGGSLID